MIKYKYFLNFEKEEKWLNTMAQNGYLLVRKNMIGGYIFQNKKIENPVIKIDYRNFNHENDYRDYCALFEDSGWKHIVGSKYSGSQYFLKTKDDATKDIFSDQTSKALRYKRYSDMWLYIFLIYLPILIALVSSGSIESNALSDPKSLYYTEGLWDKTGLEFWGAFLFETPFALLRVSIWIIPILMILYLVFAYKARYLYKKNKE